MSNLKTLLSPPPVCQVIGHRGAGKLAPENTLISFKIAKTLGLNWVEFDTQVCASGEWILIHDNTLDRTSNGTGLVEKSSLTSLKTLDAGSWFHPRFSQEPIPLLSEALDLLTELQIQPNIEIKGDFQGVHNHLANFLKILKVHWPDDLPAPLISSDCLEILLALQQLQPTLPLGYLVEEIKPNTFTLPLEYRFNSLHCHYLSFTRFLTTDPINLSQLSFSLLLYTVDDPNLAKRYFQKGVSAIFSDFPNFFIEV